MTSVLPPLASLGESAANHARFVKAGDQEANRPRAAAAHLLTQFELPNDATVTPRVPPRSMNCCTRKSSRYGHRDATMILIGYRHGLRASELCDLQWVAG